MTKGYPNYCITSALKGFNVACKRGLHPMEYNSVSLLTPTSVKQSACCVKKTTTVIVKVIFN